MLVPVENRHSSQAELTNFSQRKMHFVSELNPFLWAEESFADPAYYEEFKSFMKNKTIDSDMGHSLALEFLSNDIYYSRIPEYFQRTSVKRFLKEIYLLFQQ